MRADGPEMTFGRRLHRHQPARTSQSRFDHGRRERCGARDDQRLRQPGVVIAEAIFEPCPFGTFLFAQQPFEAAGEFGTQARGGMIRSEEHTSELQSLMRISYAVFCLKKK